MEYIAFRYLYRRRVRFQSERSDFQEAKEISFQEEGRRLMAV
jgi:hypothetical protein